MQKIEPVNEKERDWITKQLQSASLFVKEHSLDQSEHQLTLAALDRAFAAWIVSPPKDADMVNAIINCVGVAFGQALVDGLKLGWVIATDNQGSDLAVHGLPGSGDILVYPTNFVAKRWQRRETKFLAEAYSQIARDIAAIRMKVNKTPE